MGDFGAVWKTQQPELNGFASSSSSSTSIEEESASHFVLQPSAPPIPSPLAITSKCWVAAERTTHDMICKIQPTKVSEQSRRAVIDYVQRLIRGYLGTEVLPFGSVPLKTYLPDGDIDLTALCIPESEEALANDVRAVLEAEERNRCSEFEVKDIQYINAEVKLIKCLVQDIVVDISFNQLGGLCTLCFLEKVDEFIDENHLLKRSIILIKAWCYYESRILGAHHGLISTYALETLVLYVFHLFKQSLNGPLEVLYRFLDHYSKFDWDHYCVSLNGPVKISCLPEFVAEIPDNGGGELFFDEDFLTTCVETFSVQGLENGVRPFLQKHFNIVDPLKENNNLGRSVSKGNFYRIRSAFTYGACKLGQILSLPGERIPDELKKFFTNTLDRHGNGKRPDVPILLRPFGIDGSRPSFLKLDVRNCIESMGESRMDLHGPLGEWITDSMVSRSDMTPGSGIDSEPQRYTFEAGHSGTKFETYISNGNPFAGHVMLCDSKDPANFRIQGPRTMNEISNFVSPSCNPYVLHPRRATHFSHLYLSNPFLENGNDGRETSDHSKDNNSSSIGYKEFPRLPSVADRENGIVLHQASAETELANKTINTIGNLVGSAIVCTMNGLSISTPIAYPVQDPFLSYRDVDSASTSGGLGTTYYLADLSGEYERYYNSFLLGQWCHSFAIPTPYLPMPLSPSNIHNRHASDTGRRPMPNRRNGKSHHGNPNGYVNGPRQQLYAPNPRMISDSTYGTEEVLKPRGTGTYFPNTNHGSYGDRPLPGRGRTGQPLGHGQIQRPLRENGSVDLLLEANPFERGSQEPLQEHLMVLPGHGNHVKLESTQATNAVSRGFSNANDFTLPSENVDFESAVHLPLAISSSEAISQCTQGTHTQGLNLPIPEMQRTKPLMGTNAEGRALQSYHLKNDADFPPLSILVRSEGDVK